MTELILISLSVTSIAILLVEGLAEHFEKKKARKN
jgi:hypothetical protein